MQIGKLIKVEFIKLPLRTSIAQLAGKLAAISLTLGIGYVQAQAPNVTYSGPIVISKGGTYTGNYRSPNSRTPAIQINTTEPVVLEGCILTGPGDMIYAGYPGSDLTVRNCSGYTTDPTEDNLQRGKFLAVNQGKNIIVEHNYFERCKGIILHLWGGNGSASQALRVRYNSVRNVDGRIRNGVAPTTGNASFFQMETAANVGNAEIAWNQIINDPGTSSVGDGINFYNSSGTQASPIRLHDNYYQGSYPVPATDKQYDGSGFTIDGSQNVTASTASGYIVASYNQFVSTCNGGMNIAAGHDVQLDHNRVVLSGYLEDGSKLQKHYAGIAHFNWYSQPTALFGNNSITNNTVGYINHDSWLPRNIDIITPGVTVSGNIDLPVPITIATERNERTLWQQKLAQNNITPGPITGTTSPPVTSPIATPTPAPTLAPTSATFYRAFNLNGTATTIDGNNWESGSGVQVSGGTTFANQGVTLTPATDATRAAMIRSSTYGNHIKLNVANVPNGSYLVYLYVWEDNYGETFSVSVNGQLVQNNYNSGTAGHWDRLGPYATTVTNGAITVNADGGAANFSGLEIWRAPSSASPTPTPPSASSFYRAIDLNGTASTIDGNNWEGSSAPNYSVNGFSYSDQNQQLTPATDANRATMLRSSQTSSGLDFRLTAVPSGNYQVYVYVWEDNYSEAYSIGVNGQPAQQNLRSGAAGTWAKLGPYATAVTNGSLQVTVNGGNVNVSGIEVWRASSAKTEATSRTALAAVSTVIPVTLYPNPLIGGQSRVQVEATVPQAQQVQVQVMTRLGVAVLRTSLSFQAGTSRQPLDLGNLPQGDYVVRFIDGSLAGTAITITKAD